jgi:hypothetical protein
MSDSDYSWAGRALKWLAFSKEYQVRSSGLAVAVAFSPDEDVFFSEEDILEYPSDILATCGGLVTIIERQNWRETIQYVALAYYSVKEYLTSEHLL